MAADRYTTFDSTFFDTYTTHCYYKSRGASGNVYGPINWQGSQLAIKEVMFADGKVTADFRKGIEVKKDIWTSLDHKNLMRIHSVDVNRLPLMMFIVMDYAAGGSLHKILRSFESEQKLPIAVVTNWAKQIAEGMIYLHKENIVHRDLKSSNILLMEPFDVRNPPLTLKITDFDEIKDHDHTTTMSLVGTLAYMAPEILKCQRFSKASDVWSYGVVVWEMLSGDIPHKGLEPTAIMSKSIKDELNNLHVDQSFPEDYKLLLNKCWESDYTERPSFHDIFYNTERMGHKIMGKLPEICKLDPVLVGTIRTNGTKDGKEWICGLAILDKELFVICGICPQIEVFDCVKFDFRRLLYLKELIYPLDIVSCSINKCLYIIDYKGFGQSKEILKVDPNGKLLMKWSRGLELGYSLSVTDESNVIFTLNCKYQLNEYSPRGKLIREIKLSNASIRSPLHAMKLTNGHFLVSHGSRGDGLHRVCVVDADGQLLKSFGGKNGSSIGQVNCPVHLSVDKDGFVFVVDKGNSRILFLDSNMELKSEILTKEKHGLNCPYRILLDESTRRALVVDDGCGSAGRILIFQFRLGL